MLGHSWYITADYGGVIDLAHDPHHYGCDGKNTRFWEVHRLGFIIRNQTWHKLPDLFFYYLKLLDGSIRRYEDVL